MRAVINEDWRYMCLHMRSISLLMLSAPELDGQIIVATRASENVRLACSLLILIRSFNELRQIYISKYIEK